MTSRTEIHRLGDGQFKVSGELTFETVTGLWNQSRELFRTVSILRVDLGEVTRADSAGLSLLIQWQGEAQQQNQSIEFNNLPQQLFEIAKTCGLERVLSVGKS